MSKIPLLVSGRPLAVQVGCNEYILTGEEGGCLTITSSRGDLRILSHGGPIIKLGYPSCETDVDFSEASEKLSPGLEPSI